MARIALIKNGVVENVIVADKTHAREAYPGYTVVESDTAAIGDNFSGETFSRDKKQPQDQLFMHAHMRFSDHPWITIKLPTVGAVQVDADKVGLLGVLAAR